MMLVGIHDCSPCWVQIHNQSSSLLPLSQGPDKFISKTGFTTADSGDVSHTFLRWNLRTVYLKARESFSLIVLSTLAWKIPWTEEPGRLQSMGSLRVRHDWTTSLSVFTFHFHALEKEMATHYSVLAWRIPGTGEPGGLPSMGSHRVGHDWSDLAAVAAALK